MALVPCVLVSSLLLAACGSSNAGDLFTSKGDASVGAPVDATTPIVGPDGAVITPDGGQPPAKDASQPDTSLPPAPSGVYCGLTKAGNGNSNPNYCNLDQDCCYVKPPNGDPSYQCQPKNGGLPCAGIEMPCSADAQCETGLLCCATYDNVTERYTGVACQQTCSYNGLDAQEVHFCDPKKTAASQCATGLVCKQSQSLIGYYLCLSP